MAQDSAPIDSLLDFLYVDRDRLQNYAAQLFNSGVLATTKSTEQTGSQSTGQLGIPGTNVGIGGSTVSSLEHVFDAAHTLPLNVLDELDKLGAIGEDLGGVGLGDIFMVQGRMRFLDFKIIKNCWSAIHNATVLQQQSKGQHLKASAKAELKNNFELMASLPHSTELTFHTGAESIWTPVNPAYLKTDPATLAFAFGTSIPGTWSMLAILDARPDKSEQLLEDAMAMPMPTDAQLGLFQAIETLRIVFGRPQAFYAATPILIFRAARRSTGGEPQNGGE